MNTEQSMATHLDLHRQAVAHAAYCKAEKRGFAPGFDKQDWAEAEGEILSRIFSGTESNRQFDL